MQDGTLTGARRPDQRATIASALAAFAATLVAFLGADTAQAATHRLDPVGESRYRLVFAVDAFAGEPVTDAYALLRTRGRTIREEIGPERVLNAPDGRLRVRKPHPATTGTLIVTTDDSVGPACDPAALVDLTPTGCPELLADDGSALDPNAIWGSTDCAADSRHRHVAGGGDGHPSATGAPPMDGHRELTVIDGDDFWGERCELGRNNHTDGPTAVYREGDHAVTFASFRLPDRYPLENASWQVVMQMKQTQPSANGGGTPVISLEAKGGRWRLLQSTSNGPSGDTRELWTAPAQRGVWTRFAFDVVYSQDPSRGSIRVGVDLDADGDSDGAAERSPAIGTYTLKRETDGGSAGDGIAPGESIPSHLRLGIYHHTGVSCPPPSGCAVEIDNVQIVDAD